MWRLMLVVLSVLSATSISAQDVLTQPVCPVLYLPYGEETEILSDDFDISGALGFDSRYREEGRSVSISCNGKDVQKLTCLKCEGSSNQLCWDQPQITCCTPEERCGVGGKCIDRYICMCTPPWNGPFCDVRNGEVVQTTTMIDAAEATTTDEANDAGSDGGATTEMATVVDHHCPTPKFPKNATVYDKQQHQHFDLMPKRFDVGALLMFSCSQQNWNLAECLQNGTWYFHDNRVMSCCTDEDCENSGICADQMCQCQDGYQGWRCQYSISIQYFYSNNSATDEKTTTERQVEPTDGLEVMNALLGIRTTTRRQTKNTNKPDSIFETKMGVATTKPTTETKPTKPTQKMKAAATTTTTAAVSSTKEKTTAKITVKTTKTTPKKYKLKVESKFNFKTLKVPKLSNVAGRRRRETSDIEALFDEVTAKNFSTDPNSPVFKAVKETFIEEVVKIYAEAGFTVSSSDINLTALTPLLEDISAQYTAQVGSDTKLNQADIDKQVHGVLSQLKDDGAFGGPSNVQYEVMDVQVVEEPAAVATTTIKTRSDGCKNGVALTSTVALVFSSLFFY